MAKTLYDGRISPIMIQAENLDDAWHTTLYRCFQHGYKYRVEHGSYAGQDRYEFDCVTVVIKDPPAGVDGEYLVPLMPEGNGLVPPTSKAYVEDYFARYLMSDQKTEHEDYTYGERLVNPCHRPVGRPSLDRPHVLVADENSWCTNAPFSNVNQISEVVRLFAEKGEGTNQATMEIAMPWDILLQDPPCMRLIDCRVRYDKLHLFVYFRSWDLYSGFPANLGAIELLKQYMVEMIKCRPGSRLPNIGNGQIIAFSKGLHIYSQYLPVVEARFGRSYEKIRGGA